MCVVERVHETVPAGDDVILDNMRGAASGASPSSVSIKVGRTRVTVTSLVSNNVTVRYNEASRAGIPGAATTTTTTTAGVGGGGGGGGGTDGTGGTGGLALAPSSRMSPPSNMDTSEGPTVVGGPAVALVKAETPEGQHRATTSASVVTGPVGAGSSLFAGIASSNKRPRPDDWLAPNSPSSPQGPLPTQHLIYTTPQQQLSSSQEQQQRPQRPQQQQQQQPQQQQQQHQQQQQPPLQQSAQQPQAQSLQLQQQQKQQQQQQPPMAHSTPITQPQVQQQQPPPNNNGYASPMSSGSYDPYSPNGKIGRDDLSPPSSLNGYSADSCDAKKKKGPTPRQQEELCLVCGDRASGYHYNALTCEGCKGFFRRSITKNAVYQCKYGNNCEIDMYMRRKCQECRLKKCLTVGMRPECVVPEYQCAVKRKEKKAQKVGEKDKPNSTTMNGSPGSISGMAADQMGVKMEPAEAECLSMSGSSSAGTTPGSQDGVKPVSPEQEELIHRLVCYQNLYEQPSEEDMKRITNQPTEGEDPSDIRFRHITEITILTVELIVEFAKKLPGFDKLLREDQIALLKACSSEVMMLRMARKYDVQTDSIVFANNQPYTRDSYSLAGMGETIEDLLHFCRHMYNMKVNNAEYALLTAIVIFSERPNLLQAWKVEKIQEIYLEALKAYVDNRRKLRSGTVFAKLLSVLTELRTLGNQNSEMCFSLKLKNKKLPPFLAEIWDVMP